MSKSHVDLPKEVYDGRQAAYGYSYRGRRQQYERLPLFATKGLASAAGVWTNIEDLSRFAQWQFRLLSQEKWNQQEIITANTLRDMHRVQWMDKNMDRKWGLGFAVSKTGDDVYVGHSGHCPGYQTRLAMIPKKKQAVVVMTNASSANTYQISKAVFEILSRVDGDLQKSSAKPSLPKGWNKYVGQYDWYPIGGDTLVFPWKGSLATMYLPRQDGYVDSLTELKHVQGDQFQILKKDGTEGAIIKFEVGPKGEVTFLDSMDYRLEKVKNR